MPDPSKPVAHASVQHHSHGRGIADRRIPETLVSPPPSAHCLSLSLRGSSLPQPQRRSTASRKAFACPGVPPGALIHIVSNFESGNKKIPFVTESEIRWHLNTSMALRSLACAAVA